MGGKGEVEGELQKSRKKFRRVNLTVEPQEVMERAEVFNPVRCAMCVSGCVEVCVSVCKRVIVCV